MRFVPPLEGVCFRIWFPPVFEVSFLVFFPSWIGEVLLSSYLLWYCILYVVDRRVALCGGPAHKGVPG